MSCKEGKKENQEREKHEGRNQYIYVMKYGLKGENFAEKGKLFILDIIMTIVSK